jgi:hypothetical protein
MDQLEKLQADLCKKYNASFRATPKSGMIALSKDFSKKAVPINGLRHPVEGALSGWFIWSGEYSTADDFFEPVHASHLEEICPAILEYLGLAPGWRFLFDGDYEDVWYDEALLNV